MQIELRGEKISLITCTADLWHRYYENYVIDPIMDSTPYSYEFERIEKAYHIKANDATRLYFSIIHEGEVIGQIYLKHMDREKRSTEFGVALINDSVKGKGFGTEAVKLLIGYTFDVLGFERIFADSVLRNTRSQHVLENAGFTYTHEDAVFKYYVLDKK